MSPATSRTNTVKTNDQRGRLDRDNMNMDDDNDGDNDVKNYDTSLLYELHVYIWPEDTWVEPQKLAFAKLIDLCASAGFIRIPASTPLGQLREEIVDQLGDFDLPEAFVFLRLVGRCLTQVKAWQEEAMTARDFLPPVTVSPDLFLLDARFANFGFPSLRTSRIHSRATGTGGGGLRGSSRNHRHQNPHHLNPLHRATLPFDGFPPSYGLAEGRDETVEWKSQPCLLQRKLEDLSIDSDEKSKEGDAFGNEKQGQNDSNDRNQETLKGLKISDDQSKNNQRDYGGRTRLECEQNSGLIDWTSLSFLTNPLFYLIMIVCINRVCT